MPIITKDTLRREVAESVKRLAASGDIVVKLDDVISDLLKAGLLAGLTKENRYDMVSTALEWNKRNKILSYVNKRDRSGVVRSRWGWLPTPDR